MENLHIRRATREDVPTLVNLVRRLAQYERLEHEVTATEELFTRHGFGDAPRFEALVAELPPADPAAVGFALYFFTFSTFTGKPTLYLEDIFVLPEFRGQGIGKALLRELARIALAADCARMEWAVLNWNESAIRFYRSLGARPLEEWTTFRMTRNAIEKLARET
ncbi:MAG: GNAT family N-acetyltransferase [Calditrichaeota bacterium]|nr:MAG: GNAT family N-acetyltransferase [Calditrichota bacterium]